MKKVYVLFLIVVLSATNIFAIDFGGKLSSFHHFKKTGNDSFKFTEDDKLNGWLAVTFNKDLNMRLNADISYEFKYDQKIEEFTHILDLNLLKFSMRKPFANGTSVYFAVGRFGMSDATGVVFNQVADGVFVSYTHRVVEINTYVGNTNLVNTLDVRMRLPEPSVQTRDKNILYTLGYSYLPIGLSFKFPELFAGQSFLTEFWGFVDLSKDEYHRLFATLQLSGPIVPKLYYSVMTTMETQKFKELMNMSQFMLRFFPSRTSSVAASFLYASGKNGKLSPFMGFTSFAASDMLGEKEFSEVLAATVSGSISFISKVLLGLDFGVVATIPESTAKYDGLLLRANVMWNIFHELQLSAAFSGYFADDTNNNKMKISLGLVFLF